MMAPFVEVGDVVATGASGETHPSSGDIEIGEPKAAEICDTEGVNSDERDGEAARGAVDAVEQPA